MAQGTGDHAGRLKIRATLRRAVCGTATWRKAAVGALAIGTIAWAVLAADQPPAEVRLDTWMKTYAPNDDAPDWSGHKYFPIFGSGDRYFYQFVHDSDQEHYLHVASGKNNGFGVGMEQAFPLAEWPILEWDWKMVTLPKGGDVRVKERNDQAGSMCVVVNPGINFDSSLCYLFENDAPKDVLYTNQRNSASKFLVIRTKAAGDPVGEWLHERRNFLEDYKRAFGKAPGKPVNYFVQIDSNDTESSAEAYYRNIVLHKN